MSGLDVTVPEGAAGMRLDRFLATLAQVRTRARGRLEPLVFDDPAVPEDQIRFGLGTVADMTWKQMVDGMTCTECGRCQDACPAFFTGKNLSPKLVVMNLRDKGVESYWNPGKTACE